MICFCSRLIDQALNKTPGQPTSRTALPLMLLALLFFMAPSFCMGADDKTSQKTEPSKTESSKKETSKTIKKTSAKPAGPTRTLTFASKKFAENQILGWMLTELAIQGGAKAKHKEGMGGSVVLYEALKAKQIDAYPEYTGTVLKELLSQQNFQTMQQAEQFLAQQGILVSKPLGFNNAFELCMKSEQAAQRDIKDISDLKKYPDLRVNVTPTFLQRDDGWPGLKRVYGLPQTNVKGTDHALCYMALQSGNTDVIDAYTTDSEINKYNLRVLKDNLNFFPQYKAIILYRAELKQEAPQALKSMLRLQGTLDERTMQQLNGEVTIQRESAKNVAIGFLTTRFGIKASLQADSMAGRIWARTKEHLILVITAMLAGLLIALPLGILAAKVSTFEQPVLFVVETIQTIPGLALLVFLIPVLGTGMIPAIVALTLYSLLPMVRNTHSALKGLSRPIKESGQALGLSPWTQLWKIELPLASPTIVAGIKTAVVLTIGFATLGALIGAGGYGQPIFVGIDRANMYLIASGAVPAALMAIIARVGFDLIEPWFVPKGLRLKGHG